MITLLSFAHRRTATVRVLAVALLLAESGCKPSPPAATGQATSPRDGSAPRQPTASDFQAFFQSLFPATVKVSEVKMDPPTRMPNTSPAQNVWLLSTKLTLTSAEDLFTLPPPQDTQPLDNLVAELNALVAWRNAYANSPYQKACGAFEVKVPAAPLPQLLVVTTSKNQPLAPIYGKSSAEWQVDHWHFESLQGDATPLLNAGKPRSEFTGATMVKGSPEAEKAIGNVRDAITQARKEIDAIRNRYAEQVARGTRPGTTYRGRIEFRQDVQPCELRFLDPPPGADAHFASLEVKLPNQNPPCVFTYNARVTTELPIPVPGPSGPTPGSQNPVFDFGTSNGVPDYNLKVSLVRSAGKMDDRTLPGHIISGNRRDTGSQTLLLLGTHLEGTISYFFAPGINVSVEQVNP